MTLSIFSAVRAAMRPRMLQGAGAWVATTGCIGVAVYAAIAYSVFPLGALVHPQMKLAFQAHGIAIYTHIAASALALVLVPVQQAAGWHRKHPA